MLSYKIRLIYKINYKLKSSGIFKLRNYNFTISTNIFSDFIFLKSTLLNIKFLINLFISFKIFKNVTLLALFLEICHV